MSDEWAVVVLDADGLKAWRSGVVGAQAQFAKAHATGAVPIRFQDDGQFSWLCPGCGLFSAGSLADQPVSGWGEPRWVRSGPADAPTLTPSLGCPRWRDGTCQGHWWLRDGKLVPA